MKLPAPLLKEIDAIYAKLPKVQCRGLCSEVCGPIPLSTLEGKRLQMATHQKPKTDADYTCVYLRNGRCSVYTIRPLICRAWGVLLNLSCMHGCEPDRWLTVVEFIEIAQEVQRLGGAMRSTGPEGLENRDFSFLDFDPSQIDPRLIEQNDTRVRGLRAIHGGRVTALVPEGGPVWTDLDEWKRRAR